MDSSMTLPNKSYVVPNLNYTAQFPNPSIQNNGFNFKRATWNPEYKGYDDYLSAGQKPVL